jgi:hypothetical protein
MESPAELTFRTSSRSTNRGTLVQLATLETSNEPHHKKEHIKISKLIKFEDVWLDINIVASFQKGQK